MAKRIGLMVGREWSFPPAFIEAVNGRNEGVTAELVQIGYSNQDEAIPYDVLIDRISHEVPYYRSYLKKAVVEGIPVVNNPFMWTADDKFFGASLITRMGIASPKTVALPNRDYVPGIVPAESLRNLTYPLDWDGLLAYVGLPCVLKDAHGGGWKDVYVCRTKDELLHHYNHSGLLTMIVQEFIEWEHFVRCICIGQEEILPIKYDPTERKYHLEHDHLTPELGKLIVDQSRAICRALGYDMNSIEWAIRDGVPYAIDFMNPAPDMDVNSLGSHYFEWVVDRMATLGIELAKRPRTQITDLKWSTLFTAGRKGLAQKAAATRKKVEKAAGEATKTVKARTSTAAKAAAVEVREGAGKAKAAAAQATGKAKAAAGRASVKAKAAAGKATSKVADAAGKKARGAAKTARSVVKAATDAAKEAVAEVREARAAEGGSGDASGTT